MNTTESVVFTYDQFCNKSAIDPVEIITLVNSMKVYEKYLKSHLTSIKY